MFFCIIFNNLCNYNSVLEFYIDKGTAFGINIVTCK